MKRSFFMLPVALLLAVVSCGGNSGNANAVATYNDSLSYSAGVYMARNMRRIAVEQMNVDESCISDFVRGIKDAFPLEQNARSAAYSAGLEAGAAAVQMMQRSVDILSGDEGVISINPQMFIEGVASAVSDDNAVMPNPDAIDFFNSCRYREQSEQFMAKNATREGVQLLPSGLQYKITTLGSGPLATADDAVLCIFRGIFPDGATFDSSRGGVVELTLKTLIPGLKQALQLLPEGSSAKVYIPWQLGYGKEGKGNIPPYSALVYDIELKKVLN